MGRLQKNGMDIFLDESTQYLGTCDGYNATFKMLARSAGFYVSDISGQGHAWSEVWLPDEGKWVGVDCTWADWYDYFDALGNPIKRENRTFVGGHINSNIGDGGEPGSGRLDPYTMSWLCDENGRQIQPWIETLRRTICYELGVDTDPHTEYVMTRVYTDSGAMMVREALRIAHSIKPQAYAPATGEAAYITLVDAK